MQAVVEFSELINLLQNNVSKHYVLCDENTYQHCYEIFCMQVGERIQPIVIKAGEAQKSIRTCEFIWQTLLDNQAGKETILINLGGGVVSDIGGFVAASYKRGIKYVNIPSSLLAMVDAASGGKTGINFNHFKNVIGVIQQPELVVIYTPFLNTLPQQHIKNGFAEMFKHALLSSRDDLNTLFKNYESKSFLNKEIILKSLAIKEAVVSKDPNEKGLRKILNLGHTIGHAIEFIAFEIKEEILHGHAVALGLIAAIKLSVFKMNFNKNEAEIIIAFIKKHYETPPWIHSNHQGILKAVLQDKKNKAQQINMVLLNEIGKPEFDVACTLIEIEQVLKELY